MSNPIEALNTTYQEVFTNTSAAKPVGITPEGSEQLALRIAEAASDRKGGDIVVLRVSDVSYLADYFVIVTGFSRVQVRAIAQGIKDKTEEELQRSPLRMEGQADATWIVLDYGDALVHVLMPREREFYNLEAFWGTILQLPLPQEA